QTCGVISVSARPSSASRSYGDSSRTTVSHFTTTTPIAQRAPTATGTGPPSPPREWRSLETGRSPPAARHTGLRSPAQPDHRYRLTTTTHPQDQESNPSQEARYL